jgi:hypothetical protein
MRPTGPPGEAPPIPPEMLLERENPFGYRHKRDVDPKLQHYNSFSQTSQTQHMFSSFLSQKI